MIALGANPKISMTAIQRDLKTNWADLPDAGKAEKKDATFSFQVGDVDVIVGHMPAPIPWSDLEGPCATSVLWPDAAKKLKTHKSHLIVTVSGDTEPIDRAKLLTQVIAAIVGTCDSAVGVYWGDATLVVSAEMFRDFAIKVLPDGPPLHIWIDFRVGKNKNGKSSGFTTGLKAFGLMELETENSPEPPGELRERFLGIAGYLIANGPVVRDGDTIGEDANERIRAVYSKSAFGHKGKVMRLDYEPVRSKKPWWKVW